MLRRILWAGALLWLVFALVVVLAREVVLPNIDNYRDEIERQISSSLGSKVTIGRIDARWSGIRPYLDLSQVAVHDREGRVALELGLVRTSLSWLSVPTWQLRLHHLEIDGPELQVRRDAQDRLFVAGIEISGQSGNSDLANWLLAQGEVVVRRAVVRWLDESRVAPQLALKEVNLRLSNSGTRHRFGLTAEPPADYASPIDLRGDFQGRDFGRSEDWQGELYVAVERTDLAAWSAWIDYPIDLPKGSGGVRLWAGFEGKRLASLTGDVSLDDVQLRLRDDLPMIELISLRGRIAARLPVGGLDISASGLSLAVANDAPLKPMDLHLTWQAATASAAPRGEFTASELDLAALSQLAGNLPLDEGTRHTLAEFNPSGKVFDLKAGWTGGRDKLTAWHGRARFADAAVQARGLLPGFAAVSGTIDASHAGGTASIDGRAATVDLPRVFPEPRIALDELDAQVRWTAENGQVDVHFPRIAFANADIAGSVAGRFNTHSQVAGSPGDIDLTGSFSRGRAAEVWRYLPFVAGEHTRSWIKDALLDGKAENIKLSVKGDLSAFPWAHDKGGEFKVTAGFTGARLAYAPGWPELTNINGTLLFSGERMLIQGKRANLLGAVISDTTAEIPDLTHPKEAQLLIRGRAEGPTAEFFQFINSSPVGERLDHVTRDMRSSGNGTLMLGIDMPLEHLADTRVSGSFQFAGNELTAVRGLPPFTDASGRIEFTERALTIRGGVAKFFGAPIDVAAKTDQEGKVIVDLSGTASIADLRRATSSPWYDHLSGSAPWRATVAVRGQGAALVVESNLQGISSSLPEPLNKPAGSLMPLRVEIGRSPGAPADSEEIHVALDELIDIRLLRRKEGDRMVIDRGGIGVREAATLADRGLAVSGRLDALDLDAWRRLMVPGEEGESSGPVPGLSTLSLRAGTLTAFGQQFSGLALTAMQVDGTWQARINSKEMTGDLAWRAGGRGRLRARLKNLSLSEVRSTPASVAAAPEVSDKALQELPGLDVVADNFSLRGKSLGKLELVAVNRGDLWQIDRFSIANADGSATGSGQWRMADGAKQTSETQIAFKLQSANVGKLLERFGYEDAVRRANARLEGKLLWSGAPTSIDYPSLAGDMELDVSSGQFNKLEPGVGRLLGVLSLQSLPRRITLDFRDVFSEGFAFDSISGSMKVSRGVIRTDDFSIRGPAARVQMSGSTDVAAETQDLRVRVQPTLSESVALGAAIANPVAGVATLLAQKVLKDPIEKFFSYEYGVSGTWQDPQVIKLAGSRPAAAPAEIVR